MQIEKTKPPRTKAKVHRRRSPALRTRDEDDAEARRLFSALRALGPEAEAFGLRLMVVNAFAMWADCPHQPCQRAGTCRGEEIACFEERRAELTQRILHHVVGLLCVAEVSAQAFYDYLDTIAADDDAESVGIGP